MLETNGIYQKTALETVKYEVHGGASGAPPTPSTANVMKNLKPAEG